jgi:ABC-type dipeptide/oligopeptide/nickel transport system ATPase subunit
MNIISLTGLAGSGKSTVAEYLEEHHSAVRIPLASPLKDAATILFDLTEEQVYDQDAKEQVDPRWNMTPRRIMQLFGTEAMRGTFGEGFWLKRWKLTAEQYEGCLIVVEDARFPNEINYLRAHGARCMGIERGTTPANAEQLHESERHMALSLARMVDMVVGNHYDLKRLHDNVEDVLRIWGMA